MKNATDNAKQLIKDLTPRIQQQSSARRKQHEGTEITTAQNGLGQLTIS